MGARVWTFALAVIAASCAAPEPVCRDITFDELPFTVCSVDLADYAVTLHHSGVDGALIGQPAALAESFADTGRTLIFATNAGMYHVDRSPVGLYVEDGVEITPLVRGDGPGNFQMLPNGVFWIDGAVAGVRETEAYFEAATTPQYATQSGPMLVIDGQLHPQFSADGTSKFIRNGVGTTSDGTRIHVAISNEPVNFDTFARLFRDEIEADNALYLDGRISRLYAPELERADFGFAMGPILAAAPRD